MATSALAARAAPRPVPRPRAIAHWLFFVAALVVTMVIVGGITRLTESGLSIVEWKPISGTLPPLTQSAWEAAFAAYQRIPEYQQINRGMSLAEFKSIFFWEYVHRLLGRVIGLAFALPLLWFAWRRAIPAGYAPRLLALLALGALQGTIGWWMVSSGLVLRTDVSHLRLAVHLLTAFLILGGLVWTARDLQTGQRARMTGFGALVLLILVLQLLLGAFTAGLDAGYAFSSWPRMGDEWFPAATPLIAPAWRNLVDNPIVVQFAHRWWAWAAAAALMLLAMRAWRARAEAIAVLILALIVVQIALGIATLTSGVAIHIAVAHQGVAALLVAASAWGAHAIGLRSARP